MAARLYDLKDRKKECKNDDKFKSPSKQESCASVNTRIIKYCRRFLKKIDISGLIGPNKSPTTGKFSLAQASVKWKFVTDAPDIFGLFLAPSRFCFHDCR